MHDAETSPKSRGSKIATRKVGLRVAGTPPVETGRVVAFSLTGNDAALSRLGSPSPRGVPPLELPPRSSLMSLYLGPRPRRKTLLIDVTDMTSSGSHDAVRIVGGHRLPAVFYTDGANVYASADSGRIEVRRTADGCRAVLDHCPMVPVNLDFDSQAMARSDRAPGTLPLSMTMDQTVVLEPRRLTAAKVQARLAAIGRGRNLASQVEDRSTVATRAGDPILCAYLAWRASTSYHEGLALLHQWWNPFAVWAGWGKLAEAAYYASSFAASCT